MTSPTHTAPPTHVRWPPERFFWARLDASRLGVTGRTASSALGYLFEGLLPVPIEEVRAVYRRLDDGTILACGVHRARLEPLLEAGAITLTPEMLPPGIEDGVDPARLNLLTGPCAPPRVRRLRRRFTVLALVMVSVAALLTVTGLERRARRVDAVAAELRAHEASLYADVLPAPAPGAASLPPERRLAAELARLERTRRPSAPTVRAGGVAPVLGALLARWPGDVHTETTLLSVAPDAITVRANVPTLADAQRLATALDAPDGWTIDLPRTDAGADHVDVTIRLRPVTENEP